MHVNSERKYKRRYQSVTLVKVRTSGETFKKVFTVIAVKMCGRTLKEAKCKGKLSNWFNDRTKEAIREKNGAWRVWWRNLRRDDRDLHAKKDVLQQSVDVSATKKWHYQRLIKEEQDRA